MNRIEDAAWPLVFRAEQRTGLGAEPDTVRTLVRSLHGMQKEALVSIDGSTVWRLVSDEGPYLNGIDLAPFPLAFFTAGMQFSFVSELLAAARAAAVAVRGIELECDNYYSMQGSFLRGDALGGAMPARLCVRVEADTDAAGIDSLVRQAAATCPAQRLMRSVLNNRFALRLNGQAIALPDLESAPAGPRPESSFSSRSAAAFGSSATSPPGAAASGRHPDSVSPFDTYVDVHARLAEADAVELVRMAERTCFLHAAMRGLYPSEITTAPTPEDSPT